VVEIRMAGEAVPAMLGEYAGAVMLGVAFAISGNDQLGEARDRAGRLLDGADRGQPVSAPLDHLGHGSDPMHVPHLRAVVGVAHRHVVHGPARGGEGLGEVIGDHARPGFEPIADSR
jgi:hypothetical protein